MFSTMENCGVTSSLTEQEQIRTCLKFYTGKENNDFFELARRFLKG